MEWLMKGGMSILFVPMAILLLNYKSRVTILLILRSPGVLIHLRKYCEIETMDNSQVRRVYFDPPNEDERRNDPKLMAKADYSIEWPHVENATKEEIKKELTPYAKEFAKWYKERK